MKQYYKETSCPLMVEMRYFGNGAQTPHAVFLSTKGLGQRLYCYSSDKVQSSNLTETITMYRRALAAETQLLCELSVPPGTTDPHLFPQHTKDNSDRPSETLLCCCLC